LKSKDPKESSVRYPSDASQDTEIWIFCDTNYLYKIRSLNRRISLLEGVRNKKDSHIFIGIFDLTLKEVIQKVEERLRDLKTNFLDLYDESEFDFACLSGEIEAEIRKRLDVKPISDATYRASAFRAMKRKPPAHKQKELFDSTFWQAALDFAAANENRIVCFLTANNKDIDLCNKELEMECMESKVYIFHNVGALGKYVDECVEAIEEIEKTLGNHAAEDAISNDKYEAFPNNIPEYSLEDSDEFLEFLDYHLSTEFHSYQTGSVSLVLAEKVHSDLPELPENEDVEDFKSTEFTETWNFEAVFDYEIEERHREYTLTLADETSVVGTIIVTRRVEITRGDLLQESVTFEISNLTPEDNFEENIDLSPTNEKVRMTVHED
jgi:hypothetical protein